MRSTSDDFRSESYKQHSADSYATLLTITHEDLAETIRLTDRAAERLSTDPLYYGIRAGSFNYLFVGLKVRGPNSQAGSSPTVSVSIKNVDHRVVDLIQSTLTPARVDFEVVRVATPTIVEWAARRFLLVKSSYTREDVSFDIGLMPYTAMPYPAHRLSASRFPGVHHLLR